MCTPLALYPATRHTRSRSRLASLLHVFGSGAPWRARGEHEGAAHLCADGAPLLLVVRVTVRVTRVRARVGDADGEPLEHWRKS